MRVYCVLLAFIVTGCGNFDGEAVHVSGPKLDEDSLAWLAKEVTPKAEVLSKFGDPSFAFTVRSGKVVIYRELLQSVSTSGIIFTNKFYVTYERFLLLETAGNIVVEWKVLTRRYNGKSAKDIEFGLSTG